MKTSHLCIRFPVVAAVALAACGAGNASTASAGTSSQSGDNAPPASALNVGAIVRAAVVPQATATLGSIAITPSLLTLSPGSTATVVVTGTYSDGSVRTLSASGETFQTSNANLVTVDASGTVTVSAHAKNASTAVLRVVDKATGMATTGHKDARVTVRTGDGAPTATSVSAVTSTAQRNVNCATIRPFYYEIGNAESALVSGSMDASGQTPITSTTAMSVASASKWIYGTYVVQKRGGAANLTSADVSFLTFTSGYTYMGTDQQGSTCTPPPGGGVDSIQHCLTLPSKTVPGMYFNQRNPATVGTFDYDAGHEENHAGQYQHEISTLDTSDIGPAFVTEFNVGAISLRYTQPLMAGGLYTTPDSYATILRGILSGQLGMLEALGTHPVCAWNGNGCSAPDSPAYPNKWHYSIAHWVEDDPTTGDGAFSSPGAFGFYPWIEANKKFYGIIARSTPSGTGVQNGMVSMLCGHELRAAWESGIEQ
jgi:hypothetical protein